MTDIPDEDTIPVRRTRARRLGPERGDERGAEPDGDAMPAGTVVSLATLSADTVPATSGVGGATPTRRRATFVGEPDDEPASGSTIIARRESRRRAAREHAGPDRAAIAASELVPPPSRGAPSPGRIAAAPDAASGAVYGARAAQPVIMPRSAPPERVPQAPVDGAAAAAAHRREARRTALIVVIAASAVALGAGASLVAIALSA